MRLTIGGEADCEECEGLTGALPVNYRPGISPGLSGGIQPGSGDLRQAWRFHSSASSAGAR